VGGTRRRAAVTPASAVQSNEHAPSASNTPLTTSVQAASSPLFVCSQTVAAGSSGVVEPVNVTVSPAATLVALALTATTGRTLSVALGERPSPEDQ